MKKAYLIQIVVLFLGVVVAFSAVYSDFTRFYQAEGTIFKIQNCTYPNPVTTPCFYGAFVFLISFVWACVLVKHDRARKVRQERALSWLLLAGTLFALGSFTKLYSEYLGGSQIGCSGAPMINPFLTPCFYGFVLFFLSLVISWAILKKEYTVSG